MHVSFQGHITKCLLVLSKYVLCLVTQTHVHNDLRSQLQHDFTSLLAQASNSMRRSAHSRGPSSYIWQPNTSLPGWPNPWSFPKTSIACKHSPPSTIWPHPRCLCHSSSCWTGSNQERLPPPLNLSTVRLQSAAHLLKLPPSCTAPKGICKCMQTAPQPPAQQSSTAAAQKVQWQPLPASPLAT